MAGKLTLEALEVLDAIDRKGSFAAAAGALYKVPSAVTYTVGKLEEDLGVVLFRKEGRRSVLTPAGRVLLEQGRDILAAAERLVETTRQVDTGWESCLNIAIDTIYPFTRVYPLIGIFDELQPGIEINLYEEVLGGAWEAVIEGRVDLVVGATEAPPNTNTRSLRVVEIDNTQWQLAVARDHPLVSLKRTITEQDLLPYRAVVVRDSAHSLPPLTRRVFDRQTVLRVATLEQKITAQVQGLGVGFLPLQRIQGLLASGDLVVLPFASDQAQSPLHLIWRKGAKGKALRWFVENIQQTSLVH